MDNYIDIHSHALYGIDDGSKSIEESIEILKEYKKMGFNDVILTPHYIENTDYNKNNKEKNNILKELKKELKKQKIDINLYLGNELYISNNILNLVEMKEISKLNNSKYLLIELPMNNEISNLYDIIFNLLSNNIIPIIAHPERYTYIQKNIKIAEQLVEKGVLLQLNYGSIIGYYGSSAKKTAKKLLKNNLVSLLGTDIHHPNSKIYNNMNIIIKKIKKITNEDNIKKIMIENPKKILEDSTI